LPRGASRPIIFIMKRATKRPEGITKPAHWKSDPPPEPKPAEGAEEELSPTRYGDWVKNGLAIDF